MHYIPSGPDPICKKNSLYTLVPVQSLLLISNTIDDICYIIFVQCKCREYLHGVITCIFFLGGGGVILIPLILLSPIQPIGYLTVFFFWGGGNNNLYYFWPYICKPLLVIRCKINAKIELITCMIIDFFIGGGG